MQPEPSPDELERELAARLAKLDEERARTGSLDAGEPAAGLPPEAAARLQGALEGLARLHARWPSQSRPEEAPRSFGKFRIQGELGRGGHGIVFLAVDPRLDRRVALKIPRPELLDEPDWRRRFLREAHALARLDHPGIVAVLEVGEVDGVCYIASAYCGGPNLTEWLKARGAPLHPRDAAQVARHVAEAIGHAHARGVVHRDLKPRNILMQRVEPSAGPDDLGARPRVTDFGLAKLIEAEAELTRTGVVLGTPRYMAPEQKQARHDLVGPPTDVYAIGVILNEMLRGREGHAGGSEGGSPSPGAVPRALRAIVAICLKPEPARRYADAGQLANDLDRFLKGQRVRAARFSPSAILDLASRHPAPAMAAVAITVLLATVFVLGRRPSERLGPPPADTPGPGPTHQRADRIEQQRRYVADLQLVADLAPSDLGSATYKLSQARSLLDRYRPTGPDGDLRTWEWYYFQRMLHGERATLSGHSRPIYHLEYSRDGARLGSAGEDGVRIWNATTGALERPLSEHAESVNWVGFSRDGARLATASDDMTVRVWSAADSRRLLPPLVHRHKVVVVLFTPDGRRLVSGDRGPIINTWDSTTGALIGSHKVAEEPLEGMDLSPDGSILAVAASHQVTLWDYPAMKQRQFRVTRSPEERFDCVAFSHDGRKFATSGGAVGGKQVQVWDTESGRLDHSFIHHAEERVLTVAFSPDDRLLLSTASDEAARLWDVATGESVAVLAGHGHWIWSGAFAPDGKSVATGGGDGTIKLWNVPHRGAITHFDQTSSPWLAAAFTADGRSLHTATDAGITVSWDPATGKRRGELALRTARPSVGAAFGPAAERLAVADAEGTLTIGSPLNARPDLALSRATAARPCLAFSGDGNILACIDRANRVVRLAVTEHDVHPTPVRSQPAVPTALAFTRNGELLAGDGEGRLVSCDGGPAHPGEPGHRGRITCLAVSADGDLCATGGEDSLIVLWETQTIRARARLSGHKRAISALAFTADGKTLISVADRVQLWHVASAEPTTALVDRLVRLGPPECLAVAVDGSWIAAMVNSVNGVSGLSWHAARPGSE